MDGLQLYEDPEFPADAASIYGEGEGPAIEWRRPEPHAVLVASNRPALFANGGEDLPASFLGALAAVARHPDALLRNLFADAVDSQEWSVTGGLTCRLYHQGEWVEVPIDTRVPYRAATAAESKDADGGEGKDAGGDGSVPAFGACHDDAEMWVQFAVKAYAKMTAGGRYGALKDVSIADALVDLTGGTSQRATQSSPFLLILCAIADVLFVLLLFLPPPSFAFPCQARPRPRCCTRKACARWWTTARSGAS